MTMDNIQVPSLATSAMLVELNISVWTGRKKDKRESKTVANQNYADNGVVSVNKMLLGDCDKLKAINELRGKIRNHIHYAMTMPWSDAGTVRLLPTMAHSDYHEQMTNAINAFQALVTEFIDDYDFAVSRAQAKLGNLFVRDDYPTAEQIRSKFGINLNYMPLPDSGDFRVDIGNEAMAQIKSDYDEFYGNQLSKAMGDVWKRMHTALANMSDKLTDSNGKKQVFRDTLVSNALSMVDLLSTCNVTGDSQMEAMRQRLESTLRGVTPEGLRDDEFLRAETKGKVDAILKTLPSLDM
jgi:hypothetical protein